MDIKISKISYFSFIFKLNEKRKVPLKNMVCRGGLQETFCLRSSLMFNRELEIFQKRAGLTRVSRFDTQRNYGKVSDWETFNLHCLIPETHSKLIQASKKELFEKKNS